MVSKACLDEVRFRTIASVVEKHGNEMKVASSAMADAYYR